MKKLIFIFLICTAFDKNELIATLPKNFLGKFVAQKSIEEKTKSPDHVKKRRMELASETEIENKQKIEIKEKKAKYTTDMSLDQLLCEQNVNFVELRNDLENDTELLDFISENRSLYINEVVLLLPEIITERQIKLLEILLDPININKIFYTNDDKYGHTALSYAIKSTYCITKIEDLRIIKLILEKGGNVNQLIERKRYDITNFNVVLNALFNLEMTIRAKFYPSPRFNEYLNVIKEIAKLIFEAGANINLGKILDRWGRHGKLANISSVKNQRHLRTIRSAYKEFYKASLMPTIQKNSPELAAFPPGVLPIIVDYILNGFTAETLFKPINALNLSAEINNSLIKAGITRIIDLVNLSEKDLRKIFSSNKLFNQIDDALELLGLQLGMNIKEESLKKKSVE